MIVHFDWKSFKNSTKLDWIATVVWMGIGLLFAWVVLILKDSFPAFKHLLSLHEDMFSAILLISASVLVGISYVIGQAYRKYIKRAPKCLGCLNPIERYTLDLMQEKIKCQVCGYQSTFYQFEDKIFIQDKILKMIKDKNLDPIILARAEELATKFGNFEYHKKQHRK